MRQGRPTTADLWPFLCVGLLGVTLTLLVLWLKDEGDYTSWGDTANAVYYSLRDRKVNLETQTKVVDVTEPDDVDNREPFISSTKKVLATRSSTVIPLHFDYWGGVFNVILKVGNGDVVKAAFDSGSSALVIGTKACVKANKGCALDQGAYDVHHGGAKRVHKKPVVIEYGSQVVRSDVVLDAVAISGFDIDTHTCKALMEGTKLPKRTHDDVMTHDSMVIHAARAISGNTSAYVLGTAPNKTGDSHIEEVLQNTSPRTWGFVLTRSGGAWVLGLPPANTCDLLVQRLAYVPLTTPPQLQHSTTQFYMTGIQDILVGANLKKMRTIWHRPPPASYLMIDTGSTATYVSEKLSSALKRAGVRGTSNDRLKVALRLRNNVFVVLDPKTYVMEGESFLELGSGVMEGLLGVEGVLLGAIAMRGMYVQMDLDGRRMGFAKSGMK